MFVASSRLCTFSPSLSSFDQDRSRIHGWSVRVLLQFQRTGESSMVLSVAPRLGWRFLARPLISWVPQENKFKLKFDLF